MEDKKAQDYLKSCIVNKCGTSECASYGVKLDLILKIIDGQANEEEAKLYNEIIDECLNCKCRQFCEQELAIKNILQTKLDRKRVPLDVVERIKTSIIKII